MDAISHHKWHFILEEDENSLRTVSGYQQLSVTIFLTVEKFDSLSQKDI